MPYNRIREINAGASLTRAELNALAGAWGVDPGQVIASLPTPSPLIE